MPQDASAPGKIREILWESLQGSHHDIDALKTKVRNDDDLAGDLGMDSLDLLEFYLRLGENFKIVLTEDDYPQLTSVAAISEFIKVKAPPP
jgi:acyl carrier protein